MHDTQRRTFLQSAAALGLAGLSMPLFAAAKIKPTDKSVLIVVDVQNCFVDGGTLPVKDGANVVPVINKLSTAFDNIMLTQDWHTQDHASFASAHPKQKPFSSDASCEPCTQWSGQSTWLP